MEQWKRWVDPNFGKTNYEISSEGRVRRIIDSHIMHTVVNSAGYELVHLTYATDVEKMVAVHRMVAIAFLGQQDGEIDHIDRNPRNNKLSNLRWVSRQENMNNTTKGSHVKAVMQYTLDGEYVKTHDNAQKAGRAIGLTNGLGIRAVCRGWQQTAGGYCWRYADVPEQMELF